MYFLETRPKLSAIGWSLFFIWIGITMLLKISPDIGLFGIGTITLAIQWGRRHFGFKLEWFWVVVGLLFIIGSLWGLLDMGISLVPVLIIVAGGIVLFSAIRG
ncbi:MAG: hypothetical protein GY834_10315, partial [Bacteroidetes bacterium]|nr:hypothetical protein [Bacteroidota bacterium]